MHPIERLRFVARSQGAAPSLLVEESAIALGAFSDDPAGLVAACRRIVDRHLSCGPLWWLCARILCSADPMAEARAAVREIGEDPTPRRLAGALPDDARVVLVGDGEVTLAALARRGDVRAVVVDVDGSAHDVARILGRFDVDATPVHSRAVGSAVIDADVVLVEALAAGPDSALVAAGSRAAAAVARSVGVPVWSVVGAGRLMPLRMWDALLQRWSASVDRFEGPEEELPHELIDRMAGADGPDEAAVVTARIDCPVAPELFRLAG